MEFLSSYGGIFLAFLGSGLAAGLSCAGSAMGTGLAGEAASGLVSENPEHFSKCLILQVLPGTQGLYGLVVWFMAMMQIGLFGGTGLIQITGIQGFKLFSACIPMALGGWLSAVAQGKVAASAISIVAKKTSDWSKGIILCVTVEFYAILSLLVSILMIMNAL